MVEAARIGTWSSYQFLGDIKKVAHFNSPIEIRDSSSASAYTASAHTQKTPFRSWATLSAPKERPARTPATLRVLTPDERKPQRDSSIVALSC